jgi:hypothetical protein
VNVLVHVNVNVPELVISSPNYASSARNCPLVEVHVRIALQTTQ